jgi:hypothetical protein
MSDNEIEKMVREAIDRSIAEEYRTIGLAWFDRQMTIVRSVRELGAIYPDELRGDSE